MVGAAVNQSLITLHSTSVCLRGRAIATPSCVYTVNTDVGSIVDNVDGVAEDIMVSLFNFLEFPTFWVSILTLLSTF